jgi:hypothetical protein
MTIADWLQQNKRDYRQGVILFERFGGDATTLTLLKSGENSFTRSTLLEELTKLNQKLTAKPEKGKKPTPIKIELPTTKQDYPADIAPYYKTKELYFKEMAALKQQLKFMPTDEDRFVACLKIDELDLSMDECWLTIDYFNEHGKLPEKEEEYPIRTIRDIVAQSKNIPTYITKIDARLKSDKLKDEQRPDLVAKKIRLKLQLDKIEKLLDEPIQIP